MITAYAKNAVINVVRDAMFMMISVRFVKMMSIIIMETALQRVQQEHSLMRIEYVNNAIPNAHHVYHMKIIVYHVMNHIHTTQMELMINVLLNVKKVKLQLKANVLNAKIKRVVGSVRKIQNVV
jgi:hypothetical protein